MEAHLGRIAALNPALNATVALDAEGARAAARTHNRQGILAGVPLTIKSSLNVAGLPAKCGSRSRAGRRADTDATLVARLHAAGAVIPGVSNVPEFLMAWETDNALYGRANSPWDLARTPGGSSGVEAAAIAAGLSAGGIGSDEAARSAFPRISLESAGYSPRQDASPRHRPLPRQRGTLCATGRGGTHGTHVG